MPIDVKRDVGSLITRRAVVTVRPSRVNFKGRYSSLYIHHVEHIYAKHAPGEFEHGQAAVLPVGRRGMLDMPMPQTSEERRDLRGGIVFRSPFRPSPLWHALFPM